MEKKRQAKSLLKPILKKGSIAVIWFAIWQLCYLAIREDLLLVSPWNTLTRIVELLPEPTFWLSIGNSCLHILVGFILGVFLGVGCAVLSYRFPFFRELISPAITVVKATPVASFIILALIWISSQNLSVFISMLLVFPLIYANVLEGIEATDKSLLEMARVYRMSRTAKLRYLYLPQVKPFFFSACVTGIGFAWKSGIAAEILAVPNSTVGKMLYHSKIYLETTDLFAWTAVVILLSLLFEKLLVYLIRRVAERRGSDGHHLS